MSTRKNVNFLDSKKRDSSFLTHVMKNLNHLNEMEFDILEDAVAKKRKTIDIEKLLNEIVTSIKLKSYCIETKKIEESLDAKWNSQIQCQPLKYKVCVKADYAGEDNYSNVIIYDIEKSDQDEWVKKLGYEYDQSFSKLDVLPDNISWEVEDYQGCQGVAVVTLYIYTKFYNFNEIKDESVIMDGLFNSKYSMWYVNEDGIFEVIPNTLFSYNVKRKISDLTENSWNEFNNSRAILHIYNVTENEELEIDWSQFT